MITFIRSHSGLRIRAHILEYAFMAAVGDPVCASRGPVGSRRPSRAPLYNEKEFFYRQRALRRARKLSASAGRSEIPAATSSSDQVAALAARCSYLEWAAAVAHRNAAQLHERLSRVEAAAALPPLPVPTPVFETQFGESAAEPMVESKLAASDSGDAAAEEQEAELESLLHFRPRSKRRRFSRKRRVRGMPQVLRQTRASPSDEEQSRSVPLVGGRCCRGSRQSLNTTGSWSAWVRIARMDASRLSARDRGSAARKLARFARRL